MTDIRVGVVGLGAWGWNVARCMYELPGCRLVAVSDLSASRREMAAKSWGVHAYGTMDEMIDVGHIDAMVISSPAVTHYPLVKRSLLADLDVFVEKPFTLNVPHAEELLHLAEVRDRILMVGHLLEYHPAVEQLKELIASGELGEIYYIYTQRVNLGRIRGDENALWSFAPHDVSQILYMLGANPIDVSARGQSYIQDGIEDVVFLSLFFPNRLMAHIHLSWLDPHKVRSTTVVGSKKMAVFDDVASSEKLRIYDSCATPVTARSYGESIQVRFGDIHIPRVAATEPLKIELGHFIDCVRHRKQPRSDAQDGLRVVKILSAAQQSLERDGVPVPIGDPVSQVTPAFTDVRLDRRWVAMSTVPV
jgi:predicted dehydrogenase